MTNDEKIDFFNQVKGKKIRCTDWGAGRYFIPETLNGKSFEGLHKYPGYPERSDSWLLFNGFDPEAGYSFHWEFYEGDGILPDMTIDLPPGATIDAEVRVYRTSGENHELILGDPEPRETQKAQCSCALETIMQTGCNCGGV